MFLDKILMNLDINCSISLKITDKILLITEQNTICCVLKLIIVIFLYGLLSITVIFHLWKNTAYPSTGSAGQ